MASLRGRRGASPLPPFGTDADLDSQSARGRSVAHQPSRVREPSMKEIFTSPVEAPLPRGRSRGPPGGASSISFGAPPSDSLSVPSFTSRARTRSPSRGEMGWNGSGGMAGVMGSSAAALPAGTSSRSRSRGGLGVSADSPFASSAPPVPALPSASSRAASPPLPVQHARSDSAFSSVVSPTSPIRAYTSPMPNPTSSAGMRALPSDYVSVTAPSMVAPTDISSSLFSDPEVFKKVEAKVMDFKQKLTAANAKIDKLAAENKSLQVTVTRLEQDTHKLSIDKHQAHLRIQSLEADLATERRERQSERAQHAADHSSLASKLRGDATHRGSAERDLESLRAEHAKVVQERDEFRAEVASLTANVGLAQRQIAELQRKVELATQERERREMAWNETEKARLELEAKVSRLALSTRSMAGTNDELSEELRYLQAMVHEERQRRVKAEVQLEEERRRRVLDMD